MTDQIHGVLEAVLSDETSDWRAAAKALANAVIDARAQTNVLRAERQGFLEALQREQATHRASELEIAALLLHCKPSTVADIRRSGCGALLMRPAAHAAITTRFVPKMPGLPGRKALMNDEAFLHEVLRHRAHTKTDVAAIRAWWIAGGKAAWRLNAQLPALKKRLSSARARYGIHAK